MGSGTRQQRELTLASCRAYGNNEQLGASMGPGASAANAFPTHQLFPKQPTSDLADCLPVSRTRVQEHRARCGSLSAKLQTLLIVSLSESLTGPVADDLLGQGPFRHNGRRSACLRWTAGDFPTPINTRLCVSTMPPIHRRLICATLRSCCGGRQLVMPCRRLSRGVQASAIDM